MKLKGTVSISLLKVYCCILIFCSLYGCRNKCQDIECMNGGECIDGSCDCADGFSGTDCSAIISLNMLGTYNVTETCPDLEAYTVNILADTLSIFSVKIAGFFNGSFNNLISANLNNNSITIPLQDPDGDGRTVSGSGTFIPPVEIDWNYTVSDSTGSNNCANSIWLK